MSESNSQFINNGFNEDNKLYNIDDFYSELYHSVMAGKTEIIIESSNNDIKPTPELLEGERDE